MRKVPQEYSIQKFYQYAGYPKYNRGTRTYYGSCPICREGTSWGKKKRLYYIVDDDYLYCHNCGWTGSPIKFILEVSNLTVNEIIEESEEYDILPTDLSKKEIEVKPLINTTTLPKDSINLLDKYQLKYYKNDSIVKKCLAVVGERRLSTAVNKPKTLWVSLTDPVHKNRLIIPFYDWNNNIIFYQSRTVLPSDSKYAKYLSKSGSDKSLFNINQVTVDCSIIFLFEGPIDACFAENGIAVAGINETSDTSLTHHQSDQLSQFKLYDKVWVLDSQWQDNASRQKTNKLISQGEKVFIWPEEYGKKFKDFNDMAVNLKIDQIPTKFITDNIHDNLKAKIVMSQISP